MSLRKRRPVLYEVAQRSRSAEFGGKERSAPYRPEAAPATRPSVSVVDQAAQPEAPPPTRTIRVTNERLHVALNWPVAAVLLAALVVALAVSFHAGRRYGQQLAGATENPSSSTGAGESVDRTRHVSAADTAETHTDSGANAPSGTAPRTTAPDNAGESRTPSAKLLPANIALKPGYHYVFIQFFHKSKMKDAQAAATFLRQNGLPCLIQPARNDIRLIATEPFLLDHRDAATRERDRQRCEQLKQRIKQLGKEYARSGGGYVFDQCDPRKIGD